MDVCRGPLGPADALPRALHVGWRPRQARHPSLDAGLTRVCGRQHAEYVSTGAAVGHGVHGRVRRHMGGRRRRDHQCAAARQHHVRLHLSPVCLWEEVCLTCARTSSSFFQSVCVLGYCVFPLNIATLLCMVLKVVISHVLLRLLIVTVGFLWSTRGTCCLIAASGSRRLTKSTAASVVFMSKLVPPKRKALTVYPVLLFYLFISWMVLIQ